MAVVELLTESVEGLTLSELSRRLPLHLSSCVHLLAALESAGWVVRDPLDRRYQLGPGLAAPGARAVALHPLLVAARPIMAALSDEVGLACLAFEPEGDSARLVQRTWPRGEQPPAIRLGDTVPIVPPLGALHLAWADDAAVAEWLARSPGADTPSTDALTSHLKGIRRDGYALELEPAVEPEVLAAAVDDRPSPYRDGRVWSMLTDQRGGRLLTSVDVDPALTYAVHAVSAAVFSGGAAHQAGTPLLGLYLVGFEAPVAGARIIELGTAVRTAADAIGIRA